MTIQNSSWKTTVSGWVSGAAIALIPILQTGKIDAKSIAVGIAIGILGTFAKDHDKSGDPQKPIVNN